MWVTPFSLGGNCEVFIPIGQWLLCECMQGPPNLSCNACPILALIPMLLPWTARQDCMVFPQAVLSEGVDSYTQHMNVLQAQFY